MKPKKQKMNNTAFMLFRKGENKMKFLVLKKASGLEIDPMKKVCYHCYDFSRPFGGGCRADCPTYKDRRRVQLED